MWIGMAAGFVIMVAKAPALSPFWPVAGWFCGHVVAETLNARQGGRLGRPLGLRLASPRTTGLWVIVAMASGAIALASVLRSFRAEVNLAERGWAVGTLAVILTVNLLVMGLNRRPLRAGPADLVGAEVAVRARTARMLLAGGTIVAVWSAPGGGWSSDLDVFRSLLGLVVTLMAWVLASSPDPVTPAGRPLRWRATAAVLLTPALAAGWAAVPAPEEPPPAPAGPYGRVVAYAHVTGPAGQWRLTGPPNEGTLALERAAARLDLGDGTRRTGPLALSGDGQSVAYLDTVTGRLVLQRLPTGARRDLTAPLPARAVPLPLLSHDGRLAALVSGSGTELVDTATGARTALPEVRRVLGLGPYGVIGTAGHRAPPGTPATELITLDLGGRERGRVPFDPTKPALAAPDGRSLVVFAPGEVVTLDPRTGRVTGRAATRLPGAPEPLGWTDDGRLVVRVEDPRDRYRLVDPATGASAPTRGPDAADAVFGRIS
ncbi:hypothetical protein [Nonomuraea sp. NPDC048826]|uniref:hypothetical protein n=1 Tax=Nonomuraea sp. NPDC048826 TaxID=3364347 RepID=UPI003721AB9C